MTILKSLLPTAMLGVENLPSGTQILDNLQLLNTPGLNIPEVLQDYENDPAAALLAAAAVAGIASAAGYSPEHLPNITTPVAGQDQFDLLPEPAARCLKRILAGEFKELLPEALALATEHHYSLPPELLPALLDRGISARYLPIQAASGARGQWLAERNPAWAYILDRPPEETWRHGPRQGRMAALQNLRAVDPAQARALLESTWAQDSPQDRAAFIPLLAAGLSTADEPLLESCLDDRRKEVRSAALELLMRLPQSRLVQRMVTRLDKLLHLKSKLLGGEALFVVLPEKLDATAQRDGIGDAPLRKSMGEKANHLAQMLASVPPSVWSHKWNKTPEKLLQVALETDWKEPLILGWQLAAQRAQDATWAAALAACWLKQEKCSKILAQESWGSLLTLLNIEKIEPLILSTITPTINELSTEHQVFAMLQALQRPWTPKIARTIVRSMQRQSAKPNYNLAQTLPRFALWAPPELAAELSQGWAPEPAGIWRAKIDEFISILTFRYEIYQAFKR